MSRTRVVWYFSSLPDGDEMINQFTERFKVQKTIAALPTRVQRGILLGHGTVDENFNNSERSRVSFAGLIERLRVRYGLPDPDPA